MSKIDKKRDKIKERINSLENELKLSLQKKSSAKEISVSDYTNKIAALKKELESLWIYRGIV